MRAAKAAKARAEKGGAKEKREAKRQQNIVKANSAAMKAFWAEMTPQQRQAEMARRVALRQSRAKAKAGGRVELQRIYQQRNAAKKWNQLNPTEPPKPIPPLPGKENQAA